MRRKHLYAVGLLAFLAATAGCTTLFGPGSVDRGALADDATYDWDTGRDGYLVVGKGSYTAVYDVANRTTGNREGNYSIEVYGRDALGTEQPLDVSALQFRYDNGTVLRYAQRDGGSELVRVNASGEPRPVEGRPLAVDRTRKRTIIYVPTNESGQIAFTTPKNGKQVSTPTFVSGSYEMVLPGNARVGLPVLSQVQPGRDRTFTDDQGRVHVVWTGVERASAVVVRYYLQRDIVIFGALLFGLLLVGAVGAGYYWLQIRETVQRREEVGLDVEIEDDDRKPPPGMR